MASSAPQPRIIWFDRVVAGLFVTNWAAVTWHLGGFVPDPLVVAIPLLALTLALVVVRWFLLAPTGLPSGWWWPLPFLGWVTVHMGGLAEVPGRAQLHGWHVWSGAMAFWIGLHLVRDAAMRRIVAGGIGGMVAVMAAAAVYQRWGDPTWLVMGREQAAHYQSRSSGTFGNPNSLAACLAVILPVALLAARSRPGRSKRVRGFAAMVALAALGGIALSLSRGVILALLVVAALAPLAHRGWSWSRRMAAMGGVLLVGAGGVAVAYTVSPTVAQRIDSAIEFKGERTRPLVWGIAFDLWQERPWVGNGGGSFGALMEAHRPAGLWESSSFAHNEYLGLLQEYGLIGGVTVAVGVAGIWVTGRRRRRAGQVGEAGVGWGLVVLGLAIAIDFHLQSPSILWLVAVLTASWWGTPPDQPPDRFTDSKRFGERMATLLIGGLLVVVPLTQAVPVMQAETLRWRQREVLDRLAGETSRDGIRRVAGEVSTVLERAVALNPANDQAWADLAYALSLQALELPDRERVLGWAAEQAARRALAGSERVPEYWIRLGVALDQQGRWGEAGRVFGQAVRLAPRQPVVWYHQAFHFSLKPLTRELAQAAVATCLRLDPWYDEAKLLQADLEQLSDGP